MSLTGSVAPGTTPDKGVPRTSSTTEAADPDSIRDVDVENLTYTEDSCGDPDRRTGYEVVDGVGTGADSNVTVDAAAVAYGDLTDDGIIDAVVLLSCNSGGSASDVVPIVLTVTDPGEVEQLAILDAEGREDRSVVSVSISEAQVVTDEVVFLPDDPRCCPSATGATIWEWDGEGFVVVNATEAGGPGDGGGPGAQPAVDPTLITTNSVGAIRLGMSSDALAAATGITTRRIDPVCGSSPYEAVGAPEGLYVLLDDAGSVRAITVETSTYLTAANASVDSFVFDLQSVYPNLEFFSFGGDTGQYAVIAPDRSSGIFFTASGDEVIAITVTYGDAGFLDLC